MGVGVDSVENRGGGVVSGGLNASVADGGTDGEELGGGIFAGSWMGFSESSRKTSHIFSHSRSISAISSRRFAGKEEVV